MSTSTFNYFGFGSNLLSSRITLSNKSAKFIGLGLLRNYKLKFVWNSLRWKGSVATIVREEGSVVFGCVWELNNSDSDNLDAQEGVGQGIYWSFWDVNALHYPPVRISLFDIILFFLYFYKFL